METCKNCGTEFEGNFCPNCGQRPNNGRIVFRESVRDVLEHYFDFDAPLFRTISGLIISPGKVVKEYIKGRRKSYSHPFRYFILVLAIYLIIKNLIDFDPIKTFSEVMGARKMPNAFLLIYAFTIAVFAKLFNRKSGFYFVEYLSLGFFIVAQYMFFSIFITLSTIISPYFFLLNYFLILVYPSYVLIHFHEGKILSRIFKAFTVSVLAWLLYAFVGQSSAILIVLIFGL